MILIEFILTILALIGFVYLLGILAIIKAIETLFGDRK